MLLKLLSFVVLAQIALIWGYPEKFLIKNKKTGLVLDGANENIAIEEWKGKDSQLWKLEDSDTPGHYIVRNTANQKVLNACPITKILLAYKKHGRTNQRWKFDDNEDTRLEVQYYPNYFITHKDDKPVLLESKQSDDSDLWLLVPPPTAA